MARQAAIRRRIRARFGAPSFEALGLPGGETIDAGLAALAAGEESIESLVPVAAPRLEREKRTPSRCVGFYFPWKRLNIDRLAMTVHGEQLTEIYLQSRRSLEMENRGGARGRVDEVEISPSKVSGARVRVGWRSRYPGRSAAR